MITLADISMVSGVNHRGEPFVTITAKGDDNTLMLGQLSPSEVRAHAYAYLEAAEAAEQDAAILATFNELFPDGDQAMQLAGMVITNLRNRREQQGD